MKSDSLSYSSNDHSDSYKEKQERKQKNFKQNSKPKTYKIEYEDDIHL